MHGLDFFPSTAFAVPSNLIFTSCSTASEYRPSRTSKSLWWTCFHYRWVDFSVTYDTQQYHIFSLPFHCSSHGTVPSLLASFSCQFSLMPLYPVISRCSFLSHKSFLRREVWHFPLAISEVPQKQGLWIKLFPPLYLFPSLD